MFLKNFEMAVVYCLSLPTNDNLKLTRNNFKNLRVQGAETRKDKRLLLLTSS